MVEAGFGPGAAAAAAAPDAEALDGLIAALLNCLSGSKAVTVFEWKWDKQMATESVSEGALGRKKGGGGRGSARH